MIRFVVNPAAGRGKSGRSLALLRSLAAQAAAELMVSRDAEDLVALSRQAVADGIRRLVVAGGDGTFHHAAQGLVGTSCALGVVPLGRGNDLAADLKVPRDIESAVAFALNGPIRRIDVGRVGDRVFTGYCGVGFDSEAARFSESAPAIFGGPLAYVYAVLRTLISFRPPEITVQGEGIRFKGSAMFAVVCNISRFGGGMRIAPAARFDDGRLDVVVAEELSKSQLIRTFPKVYRGEHVNHPAVHMARVTAAGISVDRKLSFACDGELVGEITAETLRVSIDPGALLVVAPRQDEPESS